LNVVPRRLEMTRKSRRATRFRRTLELGGSAP
jgi:hypothetical protein